MYFVVSCIKPSRKKWGNFVYDSTDESIEFVPMIEFKRLMRKGVEFYDGTGNRDMLNPAKCLKLNVMYQGTTYRNTVFCMVNFEEDNGKPRVGYVSFDVLKPHRNESCLNFILSNECALKAGKGFTFAEKTGGTYDIKYDVLVCDVHVPKLFLYNLLATRNTDLISPFFSHPVSFTWLNQFQEYEYVKQMVV